VGRTWRKIVLAIVAILVVGAAAVVIWNYFLRPPRPALEVASVEKMALPVPDKPSIENQKGQGYTFDRFSSFSISLILFIKLLSVLIFIETRRLAWDTPDSPMLKRAPISLSFLPL